MKHWALAAAALILITLLPSGGKELGSLHPAALLHVCREGMQIQIRTDTGDNGIGETLEAAIRNLEETTPGIVLLDTVEALVLGEGTKHLLPDLRAILRPGVNVCTAQKLQNEAEAYAYLHAHPSGHRLDDTGKELPKLTQEGVRFQIEDPQGE